jgi:hypothetical protein
MKGCLALSLCACLVALAGCGSMGSTPTTEQPPVAPAGAADTIQAGGGIKFDAKGVATKFMPEESE